MMIFFRNEDNNVKIENDGQQLGLVLLATSKKISINNND